MHFTLEQHSASSRIKRIIVQTNDFDLNSLKNEVGFVKLCDEVRCQLQDPSKSGCTIEVSGKSPTKDEFEGWCSGISNTVGSILEEDLNTNALTMPKRDLVNINLVPENRRPGLLHFGNPELPWPLHTDRALYSESGDFVLVGKYQEDGLFGGEIRLLHVDDWYDLARIIQHPLAFEPLEWKGDENLAGVAHYSQARKSSSIQAPIFKWQKDVLTIRFTDGRFRRPSSKEQLEFLREISDSLEEAASAISTFELPRYGVYIVNNKRVLHGRNGFSVDTEIYKRVLVRICGLLH